MNACLCRRVASIGSIVFLFAAPVAADPVAEFFASKPITLAVASAAGGGFDLYGRILARHYGPHVPGSPKIVVQNVPGAGGVKAANYAYNVAPRDGSYLLVPNQTYAQYQVLTGGVKYDAAKFQAVGRMSSSNGVVLVWHTAPATKLEDMKTKEIIFASSGKASQTYTTPALMRNMLGYKFRIVTGYAGASKEFLAVENGEAHARTGSIGSMLAVGPTWIKDGKIIPVAELGLEKDPDLPNVPLLRDLVSDPRDKEIIDLAAAYAAVGYAVIAPPEVPADRLTALRRGFDRTMKDPGLLADIKSRNLEFRPGTGEELQKIVEKTVAATPDLIERTRKAIE